MVVALDHLGTQLVLLFLCLCDVLQILGSRPVIGQRFIRFYKV